MALNERVLIARMQAGNADAFTRFVDTYGGRVHCLTRRYARTDADAEDLTQEIFVDLYRGIGGFRGHSALGTWVYRIALNHCLKYQGRSRPEPVDLDSDRLSATRSENAEGDPHCHLARRELADKIDDALSSLTPGHRDVVILHELHGLTYAECAAVLSLPVGTVKSRLSNAFGRLRLRLSDYVLGSDSAPVSHLDPASEASSRTVPLGGTAQ
ncbi:MAG: sigma-70 family RNA polymerase sigma factor [Cytophagales bacterium]|nr:sigma-70 family RNA polymerase sigma factor [Armatimonadota bacterium]